MKRMFNKCRHSLPDKISIPCGSFDHRMQLGFTAFLVLISLLAQPKQVYAFGNRVCGTFSVEGYFCQVKGAIHEQITRSALSFLQDAVLEGQVSGDSPKQEDIGIVDQHEIVDVNNFEDANLHFDDCYFEQTTTTINTLYSELITALNPVSPNLTRAQALFGRLLHPIQDFYSHSNWIELGIPGLIDDGDTFWTRLTPFSRHQGVVIVQGEERLFPAPIVPSGISLTAVGKIVTVTVSNVSSGLPVGVYKGLISGSSLINDQCPDSVALKHDNLNKDNPTRADFAAAQALATAQTTHEWCRLVNLVNRAYPRTANSPGGLDFLFTHWVNPEQEEAAIAACTDNVNVALIIDQTASMLTNDPAERRKAAAKAFIDTAQVGDRIAVVAFSSESVTLAPLTTILSDTQRVSLKSAVDQVSTIGSTDLNSGLQGGFAALEADPHNLRSAAIFLTDGQQTLGPYHDHSHLQYQAKQWPIYTIGLGADTDPLLLGKIATDTVGQYSALSHPNQLVDLYAQISQNVANGQPALTTKLLMTQGSSQQLQVYIPAGQTAATFFINWPGSEVRMTLNSPAARQIAGETTGWDIYHAKSAVYEVYTLHYPEPGIWTIDLQGIELAPGGEPVNVNVSTQGNQYSFLPVVSSSANP